MPVKCFFIESTGNAREETVRTENGVCRLTGAEYHRATQAFRTFAFVPNRTWPEFVADWSDKSQWPDRCGCGHIFTSACRDSVGGAEEWKRLDTGEAKQSIAEFPVGAMWLAKWYRNIKTGLYGWDWDNQTEPPLCVRTPGGDWIIDSRANNCTLPNERTHRCWIRHGVPPQITVDKAGFTCNAGAGSIQCGSYHGFLQNGYLA
jgi:hypothetical protein